MQFLPVVNKARKPKFELHLKIYDLNNVPLVSGVSLIKWHLPHSIHGEHRGRTPKCPIANHRVEYNFAKIIPVRIPVDRNSNLTECPIEFEVLQEFSLAGTGGAGGGRDEKISLGVVRLNLSEYVEESEAILRDVPGGGRAVAAAAAANANANAFAVNANASAGSSAAQGRPTSSAGDKSGHARKRSSLSSNGVASLLLQQPDNASPRSSRGVALDADDLFTNTTPTAPSAAGLSEEGVVRRYLMQESKINSTLKIGILMVQVDGERNFIAPPLKTAATFGGIAGFIPGGEPTDPTGAGGGINLGGGDSSTAGAFGTIGGTAADPSVAGPSLMSKSRDASETQDMYRRALAASWACQPGELPADECIEDIFAGGDGFGSGRRHRDGQESSGLGHGHHERHFSASGAASINGTGSHSGSTGSGGNPSSAVSARSVGGGGVGGPTLGREDSGGSTTEEAAEEDTSAANTLRPRDLARMMRAASPQRGLSHQHQQLGQQLHGHGYGSPHARQLSGASDRSVPTVRGHHPHNLSDASLERPIRHRSESLESLATTLGSTGRERDGFKNAREVDEYDVRQDLVAWSSVQRSVVS